MSDNLKTINFIGCGHVGKTLGWLWNEGGVFKIGDVLTRSIESSLSAVEFIKSGRAVSDLEQMQKADIYLIGTPDDQIIESCRSLVKSDLIETGNIIFQCSGSVSSSHLNMVKDQGALIASIHPVKSFADPAIAYKSFTGTFCGAEGDSEATEILTKAFEAIGGKIFSIKPEYKTEYHAANVIVCNYLTALLELGTKVFERAGVSHETAMQLMEPLVRETVNNNFELGTVQALTGPIARGDHEVVQRQLESLMTWDVEIADLYQRLGSIALELSEAQGTASTESIMSLKGLLKDN